VDILAQWIARIMQSPVSILDGIDNDLEQSPVWILD
jgi:hypothetical protein